MTNQKPHAPDPGWKGRYQDMIATAEDAIRRISPGQRIFVGTGCATPFSLINALTDRAGELSDVEIIHLLTMGEAPYAREHLTDCFYVNSFFIGENVRSHIQEGFGGYTPICLYDIPRLFSSGQIPLDVALIKVTPPDENGKVSLGVSVDIVKSAAENASLLIAEVNPNMPWTYGDGIMDIFDIDILVPVEDPLYEVRLVEPDDVARAIGEHVASLIEDGSTIEFGIGRIPHALVGFLRDKKDLGIHTEMITDAIVDLVEAGAVTGRMKTLDREKIVTSFCVGTRRLYDYVNNNPVFLFRSTEYVNDPFVIGRHQRMIAVNTAIEVDLTGQVCSDSIGTRFFSGFGGQADFTRGARRSPGGKAIVALPSTAKNNRFSRIVPRIHPGGGVVVTRADVDYVVTEYGVAYLHGKSVQERAMALISIAHPDFREGLLKEAIELRYLKPEFVDIGGRLMVESMELRTTYLLDDGTQIHFRPIHPTDEPRMRDLLYALSQETVYYRFMQRIQRFTHRNIRDFVYIDHRKDLAIVGTVPEAHGDEIVAVGRYYLDPKTNRAEVAFVIRDEWQNRGIGRFLFSLLANIAKRNGIAGFTAEVLRDNKRMQAIFDKSGFKVTSSIEEGVYSYRIDF